MSRAYEQYQKETFGIPKTEDGVEIAMGMKIFRVDQYPGEEPVIFENTVTCFLTAEERQGLYSTHEAAVAEVIRRYEKEKEEIDAKIKQLLLSVVRGGNAEGRVPTE